MIPNLGKDESGSFDITYNMSLIDEKDYYGKNPYAAYNYGDKPLIQFENELVDNNTTVLIIHHSFANCEIPFLALGIEKVDAIDLRHFTGSIRNYVKQTKPDIVIVTYDAPSSYVDYNKHNSIYDFS